MLNSLLKFEPIYIGYSDIIRSMGDISDPGKHWHENALLLLNLDNLETGRKILRFAKNGIKNQTLNDLFPINEKIHKMNKRTNEKYKVNFANTDRLKNASIITMQKLLNEDNVKNATWLPFNTDWRALCICELWLSIFHRLHSLYRWNKSYLILS